MNLSFDSDEIWPEFLLLWPTIAAMDHPVVLSGGYGLFLKQTFLSANPTPRLVVPIERWPSPAPRSTRDMDFLLGLDLIALEEAQKAIRSLLDTSGYTARTENWQFEKATSGSFAIHVDLLAPIPTEPRKDIVIVGDRVKRKPSLGDMGIHGRKTAEAIGIHLKPFEFEWQGFALRVPNPVSWCIMKLMATRDRWLRSQDAESDAGERATQRAQAIKHAGDVYRVLALTTLDENRAAREIVQELRDADKYQDAASIAQEHFLSPSAILPRELEIARAWAREDMETLQRLLNSWFSDS